MERILQISLVLFQRPKGKGILVKEYEFFSIEYKKGVEVGVISLNETE